MYIMAATMYQIHPVDWTRRFKDYQNFYEANKDLVAAASIGAAIPPTTTTNSTTINVAPTIEPPELPTTTTTTTTTLAPVPEELNITYGDGLPGADGDGMMPDELSSDFDQ